MDKFLKSSKRCVSGEAATARDSPSTSEASSSVEAATTGEPANTCEVEVDEAPSPSSDENEDVATVVRHIYGILVRMLLKLAPIKIPSLY